MRPKWFRLVLKRQRKIMFQNRHTSKKLLLPILIFVVCTNLSCVFEVDIIESSQTRNPYPTFSTPEQMLQTSSEEENPVVEQPLHSNPDADCQEATLAGLIFAYHDQGDETLWQVGTCGNLFRISVHANARISPEGDQALYTKNDDIWLVNLLDDSERNLTKTPERIYLNPL
jgi:hypothetical protein